MTPEQFRQAVKKGNLAPAYLFLGPDRYERERCQRVLLDQVLPGEARQGGLTVYDLDETSLPVVLDDARSLSLFASERVLLLRSAEGALPRTRAASEKSEKEDRDDPAAQLADYLQHPSPGTVMVFVADRFDFKGEDKRKQETVRKFYGAIQDLVEFPRFTTEKARELAQSLARERSLRMGEAELSLLVEAVAGDAARIATEIEKLSLYAGTSRDVTWDEVAALVPNARASNIFQLVAAVGRGDAPAALLLLDTLVRDGEYLPLALSFLSTQFRQALAAKEAGLRGSAQIQSYFSRPGNMMFRDRAEQVAQTMSVFSRAQLIAGIRRIHEADKALRDARPDDRVVMEQFVLQVAK